MRVINGNRFLQFNLPFTHLKQFEIANESRDEREMETGPLALCAIYHIVYIDFVYSYFLVHIHLLSVQDWETDFFVVFKVKQPNKPLFTHDDEKKTSDQNYIVRISIRPVTDAILYERTKILF